jgi:hypothetical protein
MNAFISASGVYHSIVSDRYQVPGTYISYMTFMVREMNTILSCYARIGNCHTKMHTGVLNHQYQWNHDLGLTIVCSAAVTTTLSRSDANSDSFLFYAFFIQSRVT